MKNLPAKSKPTPLTTADTPLERINTPWALNPFVQFTYAQHELRLSSDGLTQVKSKRVELKDGQIQSHDFEGTAPAAMFEQAMIQSQNLLLEQTNWFLKQFSLFPGLSWTGSDQPNEK